jgi:NADPH:quinone reductase-like Zn-dependent oxidoreductase
VLSVVADDIFEKAFCQPENLKVRGSFINSLNNYRIKQQDLMEVYLRSMNLPTRSEVDEIHKTIYELRKEVKSLKKALGEKELNLILESLTGKYFLPTFKLLAPQGRVVVYGASNFATQTKSPNYFQLAYRYLLRPKLDILRLIEQNRSIMGFNLIWLYEKKEYLRKLLDELTYLNLTKPSIGETYEFKDLISAVIKFQSGQTVGKVVIKVD